MKKIFFFSLPLAALVLFSACGGKTMIDWADFVKFNGTSYISDGDVISEEYVGEKIGEVTGNVPNEIDGEYNGNIEKNGDASFLPVGTKLYAVKGYPSGDYVAALIDGTYKLYKTRDSETLPFAESTSGESGSTDTGSTSKNGSTSGAPSDAGTSGGTAGGSTTGGTTNNGSTGDSSATKGDGAEFDAEIINYVRTYGSVGSSAPGGDIINSEAELKSFYSNMGSASEFDGTGSLSEAFKHYDASFFKSYALAVIDFEETSGSNRHEVTDAKAKDGLLTVTVKRIVPEIGTCDMAHWYILVPIERASYSGLNVVLGGKTYTDVSPRPIKAGVVTCVASIEPAVAAPTPPELGLQTQNGDTVSYTLTTMGGTYTWKCKDVGGNETVYKANGRSPYSNGDIARLKYGLTDGSAMLVTNGMVKGMKVKRYAENYSGSGSGESVSVTKSTFALKSGSYYEITVAYEQGTAVYGFICKA